MDVIQSPSISPQYRLETAQSIVFQKVHSVDSELLCTNNCFLPHICFPGTAQFGNTDVVPFFCSLLLLLSLLLVEFLNFALSPLFKQHECALAIVRKLFYGCCEIWHVHLVQTC